MQDFQHLCPVDSGDACQGRERQNESRKNDMGKRVFEDHQFPVIRPSTRKKRVMEIGELIIVSSLPPIGKDETLQREGVEA